MFSKDFIIKPLVMANLALSFSYLFIILFEKDPLLPFITILIVVYISLYPKVFQKQ